MGRYGRAWVALTIGATLLIPAVGSSADPRTELRKKQAELERVRSEIDRHEAQAGSLDAEADAINQNMIRLRRELTNLELKINRIASEVRTAQAAIDATQAEIDAIKALATRQAVALYKAGSLETLDALLKARSLTELDDRVELLGVAAQENTGALIRYGRLQVAIEAQHRELFAKKQELQSAHDERSALYAELDKEHTKLRTKLAQIEAQLGEEHGHEGSLENAIRGIQAEILERQTLHSVAILGKSDQGFIWPLNGAINSYYGERWGRMHTGIDIDGTTGEPVVASKSGRVIMSSYYSGYGNTVIIDHGGGITTLYAHLSGFDVSNGQDVSQGEIVGRVGCTGSCTGDHLHFEVRVNGSHVDPLDYLP